MEKVKKEEKISFDDQTEQNSCSSARNLSLNSINSIESIINLQDKGKFLLLPKKS